MPLTSCKGIVLAAMFFGCSGVAGSQAVPRSAVRLPELPTPRGTHVVGTTTMFVDGERVVLWYPAKHPNKLGKYASAEEIAVAEKDTYYSQSPHTIRGWADVQVHSFVDAPLRSGRLPLLVLLPGAGVYGFHYTAQAEEMASRGYLVAVVDYFGHTAPARNFKEDDWDALTMHMAQTGVRVMNALLTEPPWSGHVRADQIGFAGHSVGGTASLVASRLDRRVRASIDMDGGIFGDAQKGVVAPALILRSRPIYSDTDLAKRGKTREQMNKAGEQAATEFRTFQERSQGIPIFVLSIRGTGHMTFSDGPFVMPDTITRFGGEILDFVVAHRVLTACMGDFLKRYAVRKRSSPRPLPCQKLPQVEESFLDSRNARVAR